MFNMHDLYTKEARAYTEAEMAQLRHYYTGLIEKYLPPELNW